jgi:hypothetical protein
MPSDDGQEWKMKVQTHTLFSTNDNQQEEVKEEGATEPELQL